MNLRVGSIGSVRQGNPGTVESIKVETAHANGQLATALTALLDVTRRLAAKAKEGESIRREILEFVNGRLNS